MRENPETRRSTEVTMCAEPSGNNKPAGLGTSMLLSFRAWEVQVKPALGLLLSAELNF